jgi:hypothetical protein
MQRWLDETVRRSRSAARLRAYAFYLLASAVVVVISTAPALARFGDS